MRAFFNLLTTTALRFRYVTLVLVGLVLLAGGTAVTQLNQELLPPIEFPQTIVLAQASGLSSEQVLTVLTERVETELSAVEDIVNVESTTTGAFGAVITAANDFGLDQDRLVEEIRTAAQSIWLPQRRIEAPAGEDGAAFAAGLMVEITPQMLLYMAQEDPNFLFQLAPEAWDTLPDATLQAGAAYLAGQVEAVQVGKSALRRLVEQEVVPQVTALQNIANVQVSGGQVLPGQENFTVVDVEDLPDARSLLYQLSPEAWDVVSARLSLSAAVDDAVVETLREVEVVLPETAPALPAAWQYDGFETAEDLLEIAVPGAPPLGRPIATVLNDFVADGRIIGTLGTTADLTPENVEQMLGIEPTLVQYFGAEHLVAMPPEVFAVLPEDFIADLDGFTRDALAAAALAVEISGEQAQQPPVTLPSQWRIQPPQILTFSFADIPLGSFSIFTQSGTTANGGSTQTTEAAPDDASDEAAAVDAGDEDAGANESDEPVVAAPEGPALPFLFNVLGGAFGAELNTADDLLNIPLPAELADAIGAESINAAGFFGFLLQFGSIDPASAGEGGFEVPPALANFDPNVLIGTISPEVIDYLIVNEPGFIDNLPAEIFDGFSDAVLQLPGVTPPLAGEWDALSSQPQFAETPLRTAQDVVEVGGGAPSQVLNTINTAIPERFAGYEVRLFNSLTPVVMRYFALNEEGFYANLDEDVLRKLSAEELAALPEDVLASLDADLVVELTAIANGEVNTAFDDLRELYASDVPPADPDAPLLNDDWAFIGNFLGVELDTADDFFRFYPDGEVEFLNSFFDSAQGISFAPNLYGGLSIEALDYMVRRDPLLLDELRLEALQLLDPAVLAQLPNAVQERAVSGGEPFRPTDQVTRQNGSSSLLVTVFKEGEANTVTAFYEAKDVIESIAAQNDDITVGVAFEQASFIEESITGVAREGTTGAIFAMIIILLFLSGGQWQRARRQMVGLVMIVLFAGALGLLTLSQAEAAGSLQAAFEGLDVVTRVLLIGGALAGLVVLVLPTQLPVPAWRATLVIGVSIPLSILSAFALMNWVPPAVNGVLAPLAEDSPFFAFLIRLFPASLTLNIMTLSGLTVAVGRIVDDSIVVLENSFRHIETAKSQAEKMEAIRTGVREVSTAIFTATSIAVVVFLPLGLTGGLIGEFFLPFGLAVTYSLLSSFVVAIVVIPVLMYLFISVEDAPDQGDMRLAKLYLPVLRLALRNNFTKGVVIVLAVLSVGLGGVLFGTRPAAFLPEFGELQITADITLPPGTSILETNVLVAEFEASINETIPAEELETVQTIIGGGGLNFDSLLSGGSIAENRANLTLGIVTSEEVLNGYAEDLQVRAEEIFGPDTAEVAIGSLTSAGGFGGFALVVSGPIAELEAYDPQIIAAIESVEGIDNVTSNLAGEEDAAVPGGGEDSQVTYLRVNQETALSYAGELSTENTIGVTSLAIEAINQIEDLPETLSVSQGFESEIQTEGFFSLFIAMGLAIMIVIVILVVYLGSPIYWLAILGSVVVAPVGAAIALTLSDRVLGISALIGLLMLIGLVITNAVVLIDRVRQNNYERGMSLYDSLVEAGGRRLRPILMTALATIIALIPLTIGLSGGGLIAEELGTVVIGGVFSSTLLTLIVVPVAYSLLTPPHRGIMRLLGRKVRGSESEVKPEAAAGASAAD